MLVKLFRGASYISLAIATKFEKGVIYDVPEDLAKDLLNQVDESQVSYFVEATAEEAEGSEVVAVVAAANHVVEEPAAPVVEPVIEHHGVASTDEVDTIAEADPAIEDTDTAEEVAKEVPAAPTKASKKVVV